MFGVTLAHFLQNVREQFVEVLVSQAFENKLSFLDFDVFHINFRRGTESRKIVGATRLLNAPAMPAEQ